MHTKIMRWVEEVRSEDESEEKEEGRWKRIKIRQRGKRRRKKNRWSWRKQWCRLDRRRKLGRTE